MKMLVCIIGNLRGGNAPVESLNEHVLKPFNADLALCIGKCEDHQYKHIAKYIWEFDEQEDWSAIWDEVGTEWRNIKRNLESGMWGGIEGPGSGAIIFAFRYLLKKMILENDLTSKYDMFMITRSDHMYTNNQTPCSLGIHIPTGQDYGGITDRHIIIDSNKVIQSLSILEYINNELPNIGKHNPEQLLKKFYKFSQFHINRFPRNMFTVMRKNEQTRWRKVGEHFKDDLYLKYPEEYYEANRIPDPNTLSKLGKMKRFILKAISFLIRRFFGSK